jgi:hypothetical protein
LRGVKSVAENGVCERRSAAGLKSRSFNGHLSARLNRLLKNALVGREIEQGLKAQRNEMCSLAGPAEAVPLLQSPKPAFSSKL